MKDVTQLLMDLVAISSVSRESNRPMIDYIRNVATRNNWKFHELPYLDPTGTEKVNLIAYPENALPFEEDIELALVCHTDTVPYSTEWTQATTLVTNGENLHGCGSCDVKGFLACMLAVVQTLDPCSIRKSFCMIFTADEEVGCVGAQRLFESGAVRPRFAIVGEPTSLRPVRAGKGYCLADVRVLGLEAHGAYPENGESAIYRAARLITAIERIGEDLKCQPSDEFSPPWTTLNIGEIRGGLAKNIVPPYCSFLLEWRPIPGQKPNYVMDRLQETIDGLTMQDPGFRCEVSALRMQEGFATDPQSNILRAVATATGNASGTVAFGTEAPWLTKMGAQTIVFGPGSMQSAHSPREFVPKAELTACVTILTETIQTICG